MKGIAVEQGRQGQSGVDDLYAYGVNRIRSAGPLRRLGRAILPEYMLRQLNFEVHMMFVRLATPLARLKFRGAKDLLVNVGAGDAGKEGWVNFDGYPGPNISALCDARRTLPLPDGSVKALFTEHFFEHVDYTEEAPRFLSECYRVLRPGGVVRIVVPDAETYLAAYQDADWSVLSKIRPLGPGRKDTHFQFSYNTRMELINVVFRQFYEHKFAYDFETLKMLLERNGFQDVRKQAFGQSIVPEYNIDLKAREPESLYVEAVKPREGS